jgi:hypothetical protein
MTFRYRNLSPSGDYVFGAGMGEFLVDSPQAVAQAVLTRLLLSQGEWFLDLTEGTPWTTAVIGTGTQGLYDAAVQERILGTPFVVSILSYSSVLDSNRKLTINCTIMTTFGPITITGPTAGGGAASAGSFILDFSQLDSGDTLG